MMEKLRKKLCSKILLQLTNDRCPWKNTQKTASVAKFSLN